MNETAFDRPDHPDRMNPEGSGSVRLNADRPNTNRPNAARARGAIAARQAFQSGRLEDALSLWRALWDAHPGDPAAAMGIVRALVELERPAEVLAWATHLQRAQPDLSDTALRFATRKLPKDIDLGVAFCRLAQQDPDAQQAETRWWELRKRLPRRPATHIGYIDCMLERGRVNEAERATQSAIAALGALPDLLETHAKVAEAADRWADAAARWAVLAHAVPTHPTAPLRQANAARRARAAGFPPPPEEPGPTRLPPVAEMDPDQAATLRKRLMGFESIGRNCEFGMLQRMFGAEPLGLLRFSTTRVATLLTLLRTRFEGVGDPARMEVELVGQEYRLRHLPSGWRMHTGIAGDAATPEAVLRDQCRHTGFLRTKLIRDITQATKILVYQMADLEPASALAIHDAIQQYGPTLLMAVRLYTRSQPAGSVEWVRDRLMIAYIDRQGQEFAGAGWNISVDQWLHFCAIAETRGRELKG